MLVGVFVATVRCLLKQSKDLHRLGLKKLIKHIVISTSYWVHERVHVKSQASPVEWRAKD